MLFLILGNMLSADYWKVCYEYVSLYCLDIQKKILNAIDYTLERKDNNQDL
ncbi:hypothetical protein DFOLPJBN_000920 [Candidatus Liberibacter asiaticus]|nr:hypothetical protein FXW32_03870 [Candidatus Liberibacter asiaticus]KAE9513114.1 hypothetical protein FXW35_03795 [Candidatus Liberibacter asiaticus]KAE9519442.1 hypothetical protein FXW29_03890 [Candidatus Liberibacter asiaticus]